MAQSVTLLELRQNAYLFANMRATGPDQFMGPAEVDRIVNLELARLYDLLIAAREDDGHTTFRDNATATTFGPTVVNQAAYSLPTDFYQIRGLELRWTGGQIEEVPQIRLDERIPMTDLGSWGSVWAVYSPKGYRMLASASRARQLNLYPTPTSAVNMRLYYIPTCPELKEDGDTFDAVNGWGILVSLGAARVMLAANRSESSQLDRQYQEQYERIEQMAQDREAMEPKRIRDVYPEGRNWLWNLRRRPTAF